MSQGLKPYRHLLAMRTSASPLAQVSLVLHDNLTASLIEHAVLLTSSKKDVD